MLESLEGKRGDGAGQAADPGARGSVRQADRGQQRAVAGRGAGDPRRRRGGLRRARRAAARAAPRCSSWPATSPAAGSSRPPFGITLRELVDGYGGGTRVRAPGARGAGRRPAGRVPAGRASSTCRWTTRRSPRPSAMIGHGGIVVFDDTVDMAAHGAVRDGVLRRGVLRQVHAVPGRLDPRRRGDRPDRRRATTATPTSRCWTTCAR